MDLLSIENIEKLLSPKDLITVFVVYTLVKNKWSAHVNSIEASLIKIGNSIESLKESIINLEEKQTKRINNLSERVTILERDLKERK